MAPHRLVYLRAYSPAGELFEKDWEEECPCWRRCVLVGKGVPLVGEGMPLLKKVCPCQGRCVLVGEGVPLLEKVCP